MMHRRVEGRVRFACEDCSLEVATKGALVGNRRTCGAGRRLEDGRRECEGCGTRVSYANFARHVRSCRAGGGAVTVGDEGGGGVMGGADGGGRAAGVGGERAEDGEGARVRSAMDGPEWTSVGAWVGGLVASIVGG